MRKDLVENIQPGVAQNMAENTLALLRYLSSEGSPIPNLTTYTRPTTVFFSYLGHFFIYSFETAKSLYSFLFMLSNILIHTTYKKNSSDKSLYAGLARGILAVLAGIAGTLLVPNVVAFLLSYVFGKGLSWFANEYSAVVLYGPPALLGALISQVLVGPTNERNIWGALLLLQAGVTYLLQAQGIGSAAIFFLSATPILFALFVNPVLSGSTNKISLGTYALGQAFPLFGGVLLLVPVIEVFVPLTGRMGGDAPADNLIATIVSAIGALSLPLVIPFAHRFGQRALRRGVTYMSVVTVVVTAVFMMRVPFDDMHQKRLFILHVENVTTHEQSLQIASADPAPGFNHFANRILDDFVRPRFVASEAAELTPLVMDDSNSGWDSLYPFSAFLTAHKVSLPTDPAYVSPWTKPGTGFSILALNDVKDLKAVIAFDAYVLKWNLDDIPPEEHARHRIKEASFHGKDTWTIDLVLKLDTGNPEGSLLVNFVGIQEKAMWPGKQAVKAEGGVAMQIFEQLDAWIERTSKGTVDTMLGGCVGGVVTV
ncbi:hypothetical protein H0H92_011713 [Tricholoma furcatifolium]|nr:hypothetical protein H0H92_011713 [Tricholoma furcatifolium]